MWLQNIDFKSMFFAEISFSHIYNTTLLCRIQSRMAQIIVRNALTFAKRKKMLQHKK